MPAATPSGSALPESGSPGLEDLSFSISSTPTKTPAKNPGKYDKSNRDKVKGVKRNLLSLPDKELEGLPLSGSSFGTISTAKSLRGALQKEAPASGKDFIYISHNSSIKKKYSGHKTKSTATATIVNSSGSSDENGESVLPISEDEQQLRCQYWRSKVKLAINHIL